MERIYYINEYIFCDSIIAYAYYHMFVYSAIQGLLYRLPEMTVGKGVNGVKKCIV